MKLTHEKIQEIR